MTTKDTWKKWAGPGTEFCLDLFGPVRRWKDKKRRDKHAERVRKRSEYAKWGKYQNAMSAPDTDNDKGAPLV